MRKVKKTKQKPFWKKKQTEQEVSINDHIGRLIDRLSLDDLLALGVGAWGAIHTESVAGFMLGTIGYKLARTEGGTPPFSQMAGLGMLAFTGLIGVFDLGMPGGWKLFEDVDCSAKLARLKQYYIRLYRKQPTDAEFNEWLEQHDAVTYSECVSTS